MDINSPSAFPGIPAALARTVSAMPLLGMAWILTGAHPRRARQAAAGIAWALTLTPCQAADFMT
jgi:hypothetical protein